MAKAKQGFKRKRSKTALPVWATAGVSLAMMGGASANAPATDVPSQDSGKRILLAEEEVFDVSLGTFYVADALKLPITVCHLPPGTSKWNKIEHRLFSFITINWRGKPLRSYRTIVQLIAATTTNTGLKVRAELDANKYPKAVRVSDAQLAVVNLSRHAFHGDWNYTISPSKKSARPIRTD